jgi:predicted PurR-regulated permease PerM
VPHPPESTATLGTTWLAGATGKMLFGTALLALLYAGRELLIPVTLAVVLSLAMAPGVRALKRLGLGHAAAVLCAVAAQSLLLLGLAALIGLQAVEMADSLPQYRTTLGAKIEVLRDLTVGRMASMQGSAGRMFGTLFDATGELNGSAGAPAAQPPGHAGVQQVQIQERPPTPVQLASYALASLWGPLGTAGVVLIVLVFVLLEHESLRDRLIRLAGGGDIRATTDALDDAGQRLSRFFVSQFAVNLGAGAVIGLGLALIGVPHGLFFGVVTAVFRFVPYAGVAVAALGATVLGAAVETGWTTMLLTIGLFAVVEVVVAQVVEPRLYGHHTGLSPLSVVLSALFWGWIWGPAGLLVSTPLTLCLVVAGRHVKSLAFLDILLGDTSPLSLAEQFYQRALSDDAEHLIAAARRFLRNKSFAKYCDQILMPAMQLCALDLAAGSIDEQQRQKLRRAIVGVIEAIGTQGRKPRAERQRGSVLDDPNIGLQLRRLRESRAGQWQGPLAVPAGSMTLCLGADSMRDEFVTEILVRTLRDQGIDARGLSFADFEAPPPPGAVPGSVAVIFIVMSGQDAARTSCVRLAQRSRELMPRATLVALLPPDFDAGEQPAWSELGLDLVVRSFEQAAACAVACYAGAADQKGARAAAPDQA